MTECDSEVLFMFSWMRVRGVTERRYCKSATNYQFLLFTPLGPRPCDWWRNSTGVTQDGVTTHHAVPCLWSEETLHRNHNQSSVPAIILVTLKHAWRSVGEGRDRFAGRAHRMISLLQLCYKDQGTESIYPLSL